MTQNKNNKNLAHHSAEVVIKGPDTVRLFDEHLSKIKSELDRDRLIDSPAARRVLNSVEWGIRNDLYTYQQPLDGVSGPHVQRNGRSFLLLSSYDYLGLIGHPEVDSAAIAAIKQHGTGTLNEDDAVIRMAG